MVRSATQFPMVLPWFNHDFFFFFFLQVRFLTSLFFFFFFCEISHPKISPWETLFSFNCGIIRNVMSVRWCRMTFLLTKPAKHDASKKKKIGAKKKGKQK